MRKFFHITKAAVLVTATTSCLGDPVGPGALVVGAVGASADTAWVGAPGEPLPGNVRLSIRDESGRPVPAAPLIWDVSGRGGQLLAAVSETDAAGNAIAVWQLGTDAAEEQRLHVVVLTSKHQRDFEIRARAVPHIVTAVRAVIDTPAVVRLGDTLAFAVNAIDPYGNVFPAPDVAVVVGDTLKARAVGQGFIAGPERGETFVRISSHNAGTIVPIRVMQHVAAIQPAAGIIALSSLGAEWPVVYQVRDDRGRVVADTTAALVSLDTTIARVVAGRVQAVATGATEVQAAIGSVQSSVGVAVQQRIAALSFRRDTIRFDALQDTTTVYAVAQDSLGSRIPHPNVELRTTNQSVVQVAGAVLRAVTPGVTLATVVDPVTGVEASVPVIVEQRVASIDLAPLTFDALGDTVQVIAVPRDRLGYMVQDAALVYAVSDSGVVAVDGDRLATRGQGVVMLIAQDPATGTTTSASVLVAQRVASLALDRSEASFDALGDTISVGFIARDRLGAIAATAAVSYSSSDAAVVGVSGDGRLQSQGNGSATVTAASPDGPSAGVQVIVTQRVAGIRLDRDSVLFESLNAVQQVRGIPVDRLGSPVAGAGVVYSVDDPSVVAVDPAGQVRAVGNGSAELVITTGVDTARVGLRVTQRPVRVVFPSDTVRFTAFNDTVSLQATAVDSLGSLVTSEISAVVFLDSSIAQGVEGAYIGSRENGSTDVIITVGGIDGHLAVVVDQVATSLTVSVDYPAEVVTLPVGAILPLICQATDGNNFPISRPTGFLGSRRGTVTGSSCSDILVTGSGYDSLSFAMNGVRTTIPVIVASAPDSVGIVLAAQPLPELARIRYEGERLANPAILALQPFVREILAAYGNPSTSLGKARALRDWIARTAVHPHPPLHPNGSRANLAVLPPGKTWADVNALPTSKFFDVDNPYWASVGYDGYALLNRLLGTLDPVTGTRSDDGVMVHVQGVQYRIRDIESHHYTLCTYQVIMLNTLWAAAGLQGMLISTISHDPGAVFIPELDRWVYEDPTFNEEYQLDGNADPVSPADLLLVTSAGGVGRLHPVKSVRPLDDSLVYIERRSYLTEHSDGFVIMGSQLQSHVVGVSPFTTRQVQIDVPRLATESPFNNELSYARVTVDQAFPLLAPVVADVQVSDSVYSVHLSSTFPNHDHFERSAAGGSWSSVADLSVLPVGACRVEYRSVDVLGNASAIATLDVWVPRGPSFSQSGDPGSLRGVTELCAP